MLVVVFRALTIILGGVVLVASMTEGMRYAFIYQRTRERLTLWRAIQRLATMLGVVFILAELAERAGTPAFTWRTPLAFVTFALVLASIIAIARESR